MNKRTTVNKEIAFQKHGRAFMQTMEVLCKQIFFITSEDQSNKGRKTRH